MNCCPYILNGDCGKTVLSGEADCPLAIRDLANGEHDIGIESNLIQHGPLEIVRFALPVKMVGAMDWAARCGGVCRSGVAVNLLHHALLFSTVEGVWPKGINWKKWEKR